MQFRYVEDVAIADVAFEAWGSTLAEMFTAASEATIQVMVAKSASIAPRIRREVRLEAEAIDLLLFELLQELIFYKDAEQLLLRLLEANVEERGDGWTLSAVLGGEPINPSRHELLVDVKAVTLHRFLVEPFEGGWKAFVILDI
ncbi:MAG TPA: archease [Syntrophobacteraceae bacterium]|nr:archease [Syntrophobacteraceae bacterium]HBZ57009.1 archease [Syntrophobacteraceae bacterium]